MGNTKTNIEESEDTKKLRDLLQYREHEKVKKFLSLNDIDIDIEAQDHFGSPFINNAIVTKDIRYVELFLNKGAKVTNDELLLASFWGSKKIVKLFLNYDVDVNCNNDNGQSPLMRASQTNSIDVMLLLLDNGANIEQQDKDGHTALTLACVVNNSEAVSFLLKRGANINHKTKDGLTPLTAAMINGFNDIVAYLKKDPKLDEKTKYPLWIKKN